MLIEARKSDLNLKEQAYENLSWAYDIKASGRVKQK